MKNQSEPPASDARAERLDDPRLTAYVLDELAADERERLERELERDPELNDEVRSITKVSAGLRAALGDPSHAGLDGERRAEILRAARAPLPRVRPRLARKIAVAASVLALTGAAGWVLVWNLSSSKRATEVEVRPAAFLRAPPEGKELKALGYGRGNVTPASSGSPQDLRQLRNLGYSGDEGESSYLDKQGFFEGYTVGETPQQAQRDAEAPGTESYDPITETGFRDPLHEPLSTFSIDVDSASYANVRRFLSQRQLPPKDAVRIEELVNYFAYSYPEPGGAVPFSVSVDGASCPWEPSHRLIRIGLKGRAVDFGAPRTKNLVFLVDVSGSMDDPAKLPLVQQSLRLLVNELRGEDRVALVVYAGNSGLVLPPTQIQERTRILDAIESLKAGGSTNGGSGIQLAYATALQHFAANGVNRVILATDGDFNVGVTDRGELLRLIEEKAKSGVFLSVLGFGTGNLKDATMEQLADHGNGNYAYVDSLAEARKVLVREMGATLETIAKDVKIQVEFNPAEVGAWRLVGYENRVLAARDFNDDKKDAGEIGAGHTVTALYEIVPVGRAASGVDPLRYQAAPEPAPDHGAGELLTVKLRYKEPSADSSQLLSVPFSDRGLVFEEAGADFRFAAAVAAFGLCLRNSEQRGQATLADVFRWAETGIGQDPDGDRREFLKLVDLAAGLSGR